MSARVEKRGTGKHMNSQLFDMKALRLATMAGIVAVITLCICVSSSFGQKEPGETTRATSREGLSETGYITQAEIADDLEGNNDEYFYKLKAGPGKLIITLEVTANETNAGAMLDLFGTGSRAILSNVLAQGANGGSERIAKSITLAKKQEIVIRIKGLSYGSSGGYPGIYKLRLEGPAVNFNEVVPTEVTTPAEIQSNAPPDKNDQASTPETAPPAEAAQEKTAAEQTSSATPKDKKLDKVDRAIESGKTKAKTVLDLLDKVKPKKPDQ